ncbi:MAG: flagellar basal body P-ring formation chaperone FlgA [Alphaproteobacteria bacterium]|nr:flagellar basal body P-ring formation chaperone FlgA [Alphaproteobacteria bacterium]
MTIYRRFSLAALGSLTIVTMATILAISDPHRLHAAAGVQSEVGLNPNGFIDSPQIRVRDIWSNLPESLGEQIVQPSPPVGQRVLLDQNRLESLAASLRVPWRSRSRSDRIVIERSSLIVMVPVALHTLQRGAVITTSDLGFVRLPAERVPRQSISDSSQLVGKTVLRDLPAAQPIRGSDIGTPNLVLRNSPVTVSLQNGAISVTMQGTALEDGREGQLVRVMNPNSKRIIQGTVRGVGLVVVASLANRAAY